MVVNDARAGFEDFATIPHFTFTGAQTFGFVDLFHVRPGLQLTQDADGLFGFGDGFDAVVDDQRHLRDALDLVTFGHDQSGDAGGGDGGSHGEALLVGVDAVMPTTPGFGRSEHATTAAHVAESTLTGAVGAAAADARDTCHGAAGTPGLGGGLLTFYGGFVVEEKKKSRQIGRSKLKQKELQK